MKKITKYLLMGMAAIVLSAGIFVSYPQIAQSQISTPNFWKLVGTVLTPIKNTWTLGSAADRISKIWASDGDFTTLTFSGVASGDLNMSGKNINNVNSITGYASGNDYVSIGSCASSHSLNATHDLLTCGKQEVDGTLYADYSAIVTGNITVDNGTTSGGRINFDGGTTSFVGSSNDGLSLIIRGFNTIDHMNNVGDLATFIETTYSNDTADPAGFTLRKGRGTSTVPIVNNVGDWLGRIRWFGNTTVPNFTQYASIRLRGRVDGAPTATTSPTALHIQIGDGSTGATTKTRWNSNGSVDFLTSETANPYFTVSPSASNPMSFPNMFGTSWNDTATGSSYAALGRVDVGGGTVVNALIMQPQASDFGQLVVLQNSSGKDLLQLREMPGGGGLLPGMTIGADDVDTATGQQIAILNGAGGRRFFVDGSNGNTTIGAAVGSGNLTVNHDLTVNGDATIVGTLTAGSWGINTITPSSGTLTDIGDLSIATTASNLVTDGNMEAAGTVYWNSTVGNVGTIAKNADAHGGSQSIRLTSTLAGASYFGVGQNILTQYKSYTISFWYKTDGTATMLMGVSGGGPLSTGTSTSWEQKTVTITSATGPNFYLANVSSNPAQWVEFDDVTVYATKGDEKLLISSTNGNITNAGAYVQTGTGNNMFNGAIYIRSNATLGTDMDMETSGVANWTDFGSVTKAKDAAVKKSGTQSLEITSVGSGNYGVYQSITFVTGQQYHIMGYTRSDGGTTPFINILNSGGGSPGPSWVGTKTIEWQYIDFYYTATAGNDMFGLLAYADVGGINAWFDDMQVIPVYGTAVTTISNTSSLFGTNVGIGTTDIDGTPAIGRLTIKGTTNDGSTNVVVWRDSDEANVGSVNTDGVITVVSGAVFNDGGNSSGDVRIEGDTDENLFFSDASNDYIGIGLNNPSSKLEVSGGIKPINKTADPCGVTGYPEGTLFYNSTSHCFCYCDGSNDVKMNDPSTACF